MTREEAIAQAMYDYPFEDYLDNKYGDMRGIMDHHELEDTADWLDEIQDLANDIMSMS